MDRTSARSHPSLRHRRGLRDGDQPADRRGTGARRHRAGIAGVLLEELAYTDDGQLATASLIDYLIPTPASCRSSRSITWPFLHPIRRWVQRASVKVAPCAARGASQRRLERPRREFNRLPLRPEMLAKLAKKPGPRRRLDTSARSNTNLLFALGPRRRGMRWLGRALALAFSVMLLALAGCGDDSDDGGGSSAAIPHQGHEGRIRLRLADTGVGVVAVVGCRARGPGAEVDADTTVVQPSRRIPRWCRPSRT